MAERRMFSKCVVLSDVFLDLPPMARCLYYTLGMVADDDGFLVSPRSVVRQCGASVEDLEALENAGFLLRFENGVMAITHWRVCNLIRTDRYKPTAHQTEKQMLELDENGAYRFRSETEEKSSGNQLDTNRIPSGYQVDTQDRIGKDRLGKDRLGEDHAPAPQTQSAYGKYKNVLLTPEELHQLQEEFPMDYSLRMDHLSEYLASTGRHYKNHLATIRLWARQDGEKKAAATPVSRANFGVQHHNDPLNELQLAAIRRMLEEDSG